MIKIDIALLKRLYAIADAHDYIYEYRDIIECLKNDNSFDDNKLSEFLKETDELIDKILEEEQELDDWSDIEREKREWFNED